MVDNIHATGGQSNWTKAYHGGPIPRLGATPGGRKLQYRVISLLYVRPSVCVSHTQTISINLHAFKLIIETYRQIHRHTMQYATRTQLSSNHLSQIFSLKKYTQ